MNFAEMLKTLNAKRVELIQKMTQIHQKSVEEARTFTEAEQTAFDTLKKEISDVDRQIESTQAMEKLVGSTATEVNHTTTVTKATEAGQGAVHGTSLISSRSNLAKGAAFTRYAMALAASKGNLYQAAEIAKNMWGSSTPQVERILKAAVAAGTTTDATWAKPLAEYRDMASEFIELLRPETIVGRIAGMRPVPFNVRIPRQTSGGSVGWVGQSGYKPVSKLAFDSVVIPPTKVAGIVVITQELARFSDPSAEALVRADMIRTIADFTDAQFIDSSVAAVANVSPASITNGVTPTASSGSTVAQILTDVAAVMSDMVAAKIPMRGLYWVMNSRTKIFLQNLRTAQDVFAFPELQQGMFRGYPVVDSVAVPANGGAGTNEATITLLAAPEIMLADDGEVMIDVSTEAAVAMDTAPSGATSLTSLWQNNLIGIRAERMMHWLARHSGAVQLIGGVTY